MAQKTNYEIACEVLDGKWGNGPDRYEKLTAAGYSYQAIQSIVNVLVNDRNREAAQGLFNRLMEVEVDLDEFDGITLKFKKKG